MSDRRELLDDGQEALRMAMDGRLSSLWTALPGIIVSVDYENRTAEVQPAIQGRVQSSDGSFQFVNLPVLVDCPIIMPSAGGFTLSLPIAAGDEVLVIFASRCIDSWWQSGGVGQPMEFRMHDLSDGFVIPGPKSKAQTTELHSTNARLTLDDGSAYVELSAAGAAKIKATTAQVEATTITLTGNVVVTGTLSVAGKDFATHRHTGVTSGPSNTGVVL